ncbi:MAG: hypothetical protein E6G41_03425 [Actinobacteria bacterium]|nr:MAG: hypothetical protein E6G41_03425 [Actinomycetota bacterium]
MLEDTPQLDWANAKVTPEGVIGVHWMTPAPPEEYVRVFAQIVERHQQEVRGQQWDSIRVLGDGLAVHGAEPEAAERLKQHLAECADHARVELHRREEQENAAQAQSEREAQERAAKAAELQRRLRGN